MDVKRHLIIELHVKCKRDWETLKNFETFKCVRRLIERTLKCFKETGSVKIRYNGGRKHSLQKIKKRGLQQKYLKKSCTICKKISLDLNLSKNMAGIVKKYGWNHHKTYKKMQRAAEKTCC